MFLWTLTLCTTTGRVILYTLLIILAPLLCLGMSIYKLGRGALRMMWSLLQATSAKAVSLMEHGIEQNKHEKKTQ